MYQYYPDVIYRKQLSRRGNTAMDTSNNTMWFTRDNGIIKWTFKHFHEAYRDLFPSSKYQTNKQTNQRGASRVDKGHTKKYELNDKISHNKKKQRKLNNNFIGNLNTIIILKKAI